MSKGTCCMSKEKTFCIKGTIGSFKYMLVHASFQEQAPLLHVVHLKIDIMSFNVYSLKKSIHHVTEVMLELSL